MHKYLTVTILIAFLWAGLGTAQNTAAPVEKSGEKPKAAALAKEEPAPADKKQDRVKIEWADSLHQENDIYHLRKDAGSDRQVVFANEDMKLYCDEADYDSKADTGKARGHLKIVDESSTITGDLIEADFGKEFAVVTGNVKIVTRKKSNKPGEKPAPALEKPGKDEGTAAAGLQPNTAGETPAAPADKPKPEDDEPESISDYKDKLTTITCERLEYYFADDVKKMIATPRVKAVQEDKTVLADTAVYEDLTGICTLTGNVQMNKENGDEMTCNKAVVSTEEDWVQAEGIKAVTLRKQKDKDTKPAEAKPAGTQEPAPAPTPVEPAAAAPAKPAAPQPETGQ